jgi:two-component system NtrC family sensor kinase
MTRKKLKDWNLKNKIILHVTVIGTLAAVILTFLYLNTQNRIIQSLNRQKAEIVGSTIEFGIRHIMEEGGVEKLTSYIQEINSNTAIKKIRMISPQGIISHSSETAENGSPAEENIVQELNNLLSEPDHPRSLVLAEEFSLRAFQIIENRSECLVCHQDQKSINGILEVNIDFSDAAFVLHRSQFQGIVLAVLALITLTLIILRLFNKLINRPLFDLKSMMAKIQGGDLNIQLPIKKKDEIGNLTASFNDMVRKLREANQKIAELHDKQMEKAGHLASLGEIAAGLAHEIKNPIAGMKGALEIIYQKTAEADTNKEVFKEILVQIDRVDRIIQDLLRYAKPKELNIQPVPVEPIIDNAIKMAEPQKKHKDIRFQFVDKGNNIHAALDADKIQQVLLNLILNSIAAIEEKGTVSIRLLTENEKSLKITVADDGSGIRKEQLSQIFQPFFTTKSRGTGLGLSICKKTIDAHEGTIEVESEEGKGTTFSIILPSQQSDN